MKPVAAGCRKTADGLRNDDAQALLRQSSVPLAYDLANPFAYEPPIAPHIAARQSGRPIQTDVIVNNYHAIASRVDVVVVEGIGGWTVPVDQDHTMAQVAAALDLPVIMVVGVKLGCLNHALLTAAHIRANSRLPLAWLANYLGEENEVSRENVAYLQEALAVPYLGALAFDPEANPAEMAGKLDTNALQGFLGLM
jgi:dethiobiotin synthetase